MLYAIPIPQIKDERTGYRIDHNIWRLSRRLQSRPRNRSIGRFFPVRSLIVYDASCRGNVTGHSYNEVIYCDSWRKAVIMCPDLLRYKNCTLLHSYIVTAQYVRGSSFHRPSDPKHRATQIQRFDRLHPAFYHFRPGYERSLYLPMQRRRGAYA